MWIITFSGNYLTGQFCLSEVRFCVLVASIELFLRLKVWRNSECVPWMLCVLSYLSSVASSYISVTPKWNICYHSRISVSKLCVFKGLGCNIL